MSRVWMEPLAARRFLSRLAAHEPLEEEDATVELPLLARWLVAEELGPLAHHLAQNSFPALAAHLQGDAISAFAENSIHFDRLRRIQKGFQRAGLPVVLLKGAALAEPAYGGAGLRSMSDVDIWVGPGQMADASAVMAELGFVAGGKEERPVQLRLLSGGEIAFYDANGGLVELHWSPFSGWWLTRVTAIEEEAIWSRIEPLALQEMVQTAPRTGVAGRRDGEDAVANIYQLSAEDTIIHVAVHMAINHQFGRAAIRSLLDIGLTARARPVDWQLVATRARRWRLGVALWTSLNLAEQLIGLDEARPALTVLQPSSLRRNLLSRFVSPEILLAGVDRRRSRSRYLLLLLLVDRPRDMLRLFYRTLWPEPEWMAARYGEDGSRRQHLWNVLRRGQI